MTPVLRRLKQEDRKFETSLDFRVRPRGKSEMKKRIQNEII